MEPKDKPTKEVIAATDEIFEAEAEPPPVVMNEPAAPDEPPTPNVLPRKRRVPDPSEAAPPPSPLRDPLRELQQEFQDHEEEGKL